MPSSKKSKKDKKKRRNGSSKRLYDGDTSSSSVLQPPVKKCKVVYQNFCPADIPHEFLEGFFLPCLQFKEHLKNLINWMICRNVLKKPKECRSCGGLDISLIEAASEDLKIWFHFECTNCNEQTSIRSGSFFERLECSIPEALLCILAWCNQDSPYQASSSTGVPMKTVSQIFLQCLKTTENYITQTNAMRELVLGGPDSVVLLDVWPHGFIPVNGNKRESKQRHRDRLRVLWIADTKHVPVRCWPRLLPHCRSLKELQELQFLEGGSVQIVQKLQCLEETDMHADPNPRTERLQRRQRILKEQQEVLGQDEKDFKGPEAEKENQSRDFLQRKSSQIAFECQTTDLEMKEKFDQSEAFAWAQKSVCLPQTPEVHFKNELLNAVLSVAEDHIAQGSLILVNEEAMPNLTSILLATGKYDAGTSFNKVLTLSGCDGSPADGILENIWQPAINLCEKMKTQTRHTASGTIAEFQWRYLFGSQISTSLFNILCHISSHYANASVKASVSLPKNEV